MLLHMEQKFHDLRRLLFNDRVFQTCEEEEASLEGNQGLNDGDLVEERGKRVL